MKINLTKSTLISMVAVLVGIIGLLICLLPSRTAPQALLADYVDAINDADMEAMQECMFSASDVMGEMGDALGDLADSLGGIANSGDPTVNDVYKALKSSIFSTSRIPEGITEVKEVAIQGCVDGEEQTAMQITGYSMAVVLEITYVDKDGAEQTLLTTETVEVIKAKGDYKIAG